MRSLGCSFPMPDLTHQAISVSSYFQSFKPQTVTLLPSTVFLACLQAFLHQGPLSQAGRVRSLPLRKRGLWHNPGKVFEAPSWESLPFSKSPGMLSSCTSGRIDRPGACVLPARGFKVLVLAGCVILRRRGWQSSCRWSFELPSFPLRFFIPCSNVEVRRS